MREKRNQPKITKRRRQKRIKKKKKEMMRIYQQLDTIHLNLSFLLHPPPQRIRRRRMKGMVVH